MSTGLTKADIEAAVDAARGRKGPQIELRDLRFRAGERSANWSLMVGLHTGERSRITLGSWPALSIARQSGGSGKCASVRVDVGGRRYLKTKKKTMKARNH